MKLKKLRVITFSPCGGTLKAALAIAGGVPLETAVDDLTRPGLRAKALVCGPEELALIAFPVYGGYLPGGISSTLFGLLSAQSTPAVLLAVYGNREFEGAFLEMAELAEARGFWPVAAAAAVAEHSINPRIASGRPDPGDQGLLADFGRRIFERLSAQPDLAAFDFQVPGAYPNRPKGASARPAAAPDICTACGDCVEPCPMSAIPKDEPAATGDSCIGCMACVKICPVKARALVDPGLAEKMAWLESVTKERKEPLFFF